jgi:hypothetical protein
LLDRHIRVNLFARTVHFGETVLAKSKLKYYVYLSATKVDMLYSQIPPAFLKGAEAELKINLAVVSSSIKGRGPEEATELPARTAAVASYIREQNGVGTVDNPQQWIEGGTSMRWGCVREYASDIAFFGGKVGDKTIALLGSSDSLIGAPKVSEASHAPFYYTMRFFNQMLENRRFKIADDDHPTDEGPVGKPPYYSYDDSVKIALGALAGSDAKLEFLAFVLHKENKLIVATPLYVALSD